MTSSNRTTPDRLDAAQDKPAGDPHTAPAGLQDRQRQLREADRIASEFDNIEAKAAEYRADLQPPPQGASIPMSRTGTASTVSEDRMNAKTGQAATAGQCPQSGVLATMRADGDERVLTTNQGVPVADNQNSLKAGASGPALLKDFILREKITHFDHERIPERIVHARGSGAHGFFECYESLSDITAASIFSEASKITPVFVRFSTVAGERGSKDTARDVRGFAVKFYTDEGNWDLVGNNIPVFFIQDAMKFPDLVHAVKPEPHHAMPQAASAHDTFWDFVSLMPESTHMLMWLMSDRAIPRSYRMMQGFGVHTYRFVASDGASHFVKFHWTPRLGTHALLWDEAVKISGADPDYHRRDLWEAIESGEYPEWELGIQLFSSELAEAFDFDVLDATKLIPEELVPVRPIGRLVLDRNPDNFFAETEQVAFCVAHVVPGIDFSNDPLLAGRIHSYVDTQLSRLGGPNFHEIPINAPLAPVHNHQRDGMHRQAVHRGRVSYEPNSLGGGCPFQAGAQGFVSFPEPVEGHELRVKPPKFAEHYRQATLFYESQTNVEKAHIAAAFRFELSKVTVPAIRERTVSMLRNASEELARKVADGLGMQTLPPPMATVSGSPQPTTPQRSPSLSMLARPGDGGVRTRQVAILIADGVDAATVTTLRQALEGEGAVVKLVGPRIGDIGGAKPPGLIADASLETEPSVLFDGMIVPGGERCVQVLMDDGRALEFVRDQFRHCKPILVIGEAHRLLALAGVPLDHEDGGLLRVEAIDDAVPFRFIAALAAHRHHERETDPPIA
jgi:catalase